MTGSTRKNSKSNNKPAKSALETAYTFLASRMRTVAETENHLKDMGFSEGEIQEAVNDLIGLRYLDDYQYALRYYEYNHERRRGTARAARELAAKGVDSETIRNAREDFLYAGGIDEYEDALYVAKRELELRNKAEFDDKTAGSIARKLENRGFERDIIFRVLDRLRSGCAGGEE